MTNKNTKNENENKYQITERVFANDSKSLQDILTIYLDKKVEKVIDGLYNGQEVKATLSEREVA